MQNRVVIDGNRINTIAKLFKNLGLHSIKRLELIDPQMSAARMIRDKCGSKTPVLLFINALVSYMLVMKGEEYWLKYASSIPSRCPEDWGNALRVVEEFTRRHNRYALANKLSRLRALKKCGSLEHLIYDREYKYLWMETARCLRTSPNAKTVVFAVKMAYYGHRVNGFDDTLPMEIPLPVDRRVALITVLSGIVRIRDSGNFYEETRVLMKKSDLVRKAWSRVSAYSSIPPLHLDAVLWLLGGYADIRSRHRIFLQLEEDYGLSRIIGLDSLRSLVDELFYFLPSR